MIITLIFATLAVTASFVLEYLMDFIPCKLCYVQRWLWVTYLIVTLFGLLLNSNYKLVFFILSIFISLIIFSFGFYHVGIEKGRFQNYFDCSVVSGLEATTIKELNEAILNTEFRDCSIPSVSFVGLSLASWSALLAVSLLLYSLTSTIININSFLWKKKK